MTDFIGGAIYTEDSLVERHEPNEESLRLRFMIQETDKCPPLEELLIPLKLHRQ